MMPPPKKPKTGPTSMDQFLSTEELKMAPEKCRSVYERTHSDDVVLRDRTGVFPSSDAANGKHRSRTGSYSSESDTRSVSPRERQDNDTNTSHTGEGHQRSPGLKLLRELIMKKSSGETEEQKVPSCLSTSARSPQSDGGVSPTVAECAEEVENRRKRKFPMKLDIKLEPNPEKTEKPFMKTPPISPKTVLAETKHRSPSLRLGPLDDRSTGRNVTSVMSTIPHSLPLTSLPGYFPSYLYGHHSIPLNSMFMNGLESEPKDLSCKMHKNDNGLPDNRFYEGLGSSLCDRNVSSFPLHLGMNHFNGTRRLENDKQYLEARKNLVGILKEPRYEEPNNVSYPTPQEKDNPFAFPFFMNGFGMHSRDALDKYGGKEEHPGAMGMISPGSYLSHLLPSVNQVPSSTTTEHEAGILPMLDPTFASRKFKPQGSASGTNKLCQVCNDNASGFHYGVWSCEGCKAFFKRSIQGPVDYVCPATNTCTIDKHRRKSCQACRLRKCYEVGMNKGSQRKDRKNSISSISSSLNSGAMKSNQAKRSRADSSDNAVNSTSGGSPTPTKSPKRSQTSLILEALAKEELPVLESHHNHSLPPTKVHLLNSLIKLAEKELVHLINWAKNVPGYTDLSLSDQVHLIECCWMELLLLNCAYRSVDHEGRRLVFAPDFTLDRRYWQIMEMTEVLEQVSAVSEQITQYNLHKDEFLLLQATVLVNAEIRQLTSNSKIKEMRQILLDAMLDTAQKYHPDNPRHVPNLMLLLSHIRKVGERGIDRFQKLKSEKTVTFSDLLKEMLDAQDYTETKPSASASASE